MALWGESGPVRRKWSVGNKWPLAGGQEAEAQTVFERSPPPTSRRSRPRPLGWPPWRHRRWWPPTSATRRRSGSSWRSSRLTPVTSSPPGPRPGDQWPTTWAFSTPVSVASKGRGPPSPLPPTSTIAWARPPSSLRAGCSGPRCSSCIATAPATRHGPRSSSPRPSSESASPPRGVRVGVPTAHGSESFDEAGWPSPSGGEESGARSFPRLATSSRIASAAEDKSSATRARALSRFLSLMCPSPVCSRSGDCDVPAGETVSARSAASPFFSAHLQIVHRFDEERTKKGLLKSDETVASACTRPAFPMLSSVAAARGVVGMRASS